MARQGLTIATNGELANPTDVVCHQSEDISWQANFQEPSLPLRPYIHGRYQGWVENTRQTFCRREIPSGKVGLIINLGANYRLVNPHVFSAPSGLLDSFVAGLHETFALVESSGTSECIQIDFTPIGARLFFGVSMGSLANHVVEMDAILGKAARSLVAQLRDTRDWSRRFAILEAFLMQRMLNSQQPSRSLLWAWGQLEASAGRVEIGTLAEEVGWSRKHLIAQFREYVGLPPKSLARILRFRQAIGLLEENTSIRWVDVALRSGYYDQAHFNRDFHQFAGCSPTEYLGRLLPDHGGVRG